MGNCVASTLSDKLGTDVTIGRIDVGFLNRLTLDDVQVMDRQNEPILQANRISVKVALWPLLSGQIRISSAQIFGAHVNMYREHADSEPNWQFVTDAFASNDSTKKPSPPDMTVNSLIIRHSTLQYHQRDAVPPAEGKFDLQHLNVSDISAHLSLKQLTADSLSVNLKRLAFSEQSGLHVQRLSAKLEVGREKALLTNFQLDMPTSHLRVDTVNATYKEGKIAETLELSGQLVDSQLTPSDFSSVFSELEAFKSTLNLGLDIDVGRQRINLSEFTVNTPSGDIEVNAYGYYNAGEIQGQIRQLQLRGTTLAALQKAIPNMPGPLQQLNTITLNGSINRKPNEKLVANSHLNTNAGTLTAHIEIIDTEHYTLDISTDSLNIGKLISNEHMGMLASDMKFIVNQQDISADGQINNFTYNGYTYNAITLNGTIKSDGLVSGKISISDPNVSTTLEGSMQRMKNLMTLRIIGTVDKIAPERLHLTNRWGDVQFSAIVDADITASSLNDAEGTIDLDDFVMTAADSSATAYRIDNLHIRSGYTDGQHFLRVDGDMGTAELKGQFDISTLKQSFVRYIASRLPTLPGLPSTIKPSDNNFDLELKLNDSRWMSRIMGIPFNLDAPLSVDARVNDSINFIDIVATMPAFTYNGNSYVNGRMALTTDGDSTVSNISLTRQMPRTPEEHLRGKNDRELLLQLTAQAGNNNLITSLNFDNYDVDGELQADMRGTINAITRLYTNEQGIPEAQVRVMPSQLFLQGADWQLEPCDIIYTQNHFTVDHFTLHYADQHLIVDGIASPQVSDTLAIDLQNVNVAYLLDIINFHSVRFGGNATGRAVLTSLLGEPTMSSQLDVEQFTFLDGRMGTLYADVEWNAEERQIELSALASDGPTAVTHIDGYIAPSPRKEIDLSIRAEDTHIGFIHSFTKSFLNNIDGKAWGELKVSGPLNQMDLTGSMVINGKADVPPLGTTYTMNDDTLCFTPGGEIVFDGFKVTDRNGHIAMMGGSIHHNHLKNFTFDLSLDADQLLLYDHQGFLADAHASSGDIAGMVIANGHADIIGRQGEVTINCNVTPLQGSVFAYNTASPDAISNQQFIKWGKKTSSNMQTQKSSPKISEGGLLSSDLRINLNINTTPAVSLRLLMDQHSGDHIELYGNGAINATYYNKGPFQMFGTYTVANGIYTITIQNILKKTFNFQEGGTVVFGGNPFDANLNLKASHTVSGVSLSDLNIGNSFTNNTVRVNCIMNIQGQAGAPSVEFDMEMPTVNTEEQQMIRSAIASQQELNQQVLYLLGIGRFYTQGANNATSQQYDQTQLAMQSLLSGTVSSQINEVLAQVLRSSDWNFGANITTGNEGWHNAEYEGLVSGRLLNNRLLINGQFGYRDNATQTTPTFIGDFDVRYLLSPNGNIALKVYNQTNDRYFTRSSLNTQGIGIVLKRDFNGLSDLFGHKKREKKLTKN